MLAICKLYLSIFVIIGITNSMLASTEVKKNANNATGDDLTTAWARQIIRLSKAADISVMLNTKVNPCNDFYKYSCGNWHRSNPAQLLSNIMTDKFQLLAKTFDHRLETMLEEVKLRDGLETKIRNFYKACQVVKSDDLLYRLELENVYKEFGEMPALLAADTAWKEDDFNWWEMIAKIQHKYGISILLSVDIMGDVKNNTVNRVYIGPPEFSELRNSKFANVLQETAILKDLVDYFGVEQKIAKKAAKEMIEFEQAIITGSTDARLGFGFQELLDIHQISELQNLYNESIDITRYLNIVLGADAPELVYVYDVNYLDNLVAVMKKKPKHVVVNYVLWQLLREFIIEVANSELPKWCLGQTKKYFGKYIDHMVYKRYRNDEMEQDINELWEEIRSAFRDDLKGDKLDWISNSTREYAIQKLDAMELSVNSYDNENFTAEYGALDIDALKYVGNIQQLLMESSRRHLAKLNQTGTSIEATEILSFTPAYNILENNIKIPVALMQPRFFWDVNYPHALKYATVGYLIAHEMIHGFDDDGRKYDKHGNILDWWDVKSTYEFEARRKCFQAQYHEYKYGGKKLPESVSQAENIADNAAIKIAYKAYSRWLQKQHATDPTIEEKELLSGLQLNNHQLFFVSFAQVWCEDVQTLFKKSVAAGDIHAPGMYRVIGSLSNFQEFSWVFHCKPDAPMDPEYKCSIY